MNEKQRGPERGGAPIVMVLVVLLVLSPLLYVLSIGPVAGMLEAGWISKHWEPTLEVAYSPLLWTANRVPPVESALTNYMLLWVTPNEAVYVPTTAAAGPIPAPAPAGS